MFNLHNLSDIQVEMSNQIYGLKFRGENWIAQKFESLFSHQWLPRMFVKLNKSSPPQVKISETSFIVSVNYPPIPLLFTIGKGWYRGKKKKHLTSGRRVGILLYHITAG